MKIEKTEPVDTAPIVISDFSGPAGQLLKLNPPLKIVSIRLTDDGELLAEYELLGIAVGADSREELADEIRDYLQHLWLAFVLEPAQTLTPAAEQLRNSLLEIVQQ